MNAAQPFILIVVQIGNTKFATFLSACKLFSAQLNVTGKVAADDLVQNATATALNICEKTCNGFNFLNSKNNGKIITNWIVLEATIMEKYVAKPPSSTPLENSATVLKL